MGRMLFSWNTELFFYSYQDSVGGTIPCPSSGLLGGCVFGRGSKHVIKRHPFPLDHSLPPFSSPFISIHLPKCSPLLLPPPLPLSPLRFLSLVGVCPVVSYLLSCFTWPHIHWSADMNDHGVLLYFSIEFLLDRRPCFCLSFPQEKLLSRSLQRGEDAQFDQVSSSVCVHMHCYYGPSPSPPAIIVPPHLPFIQ